MLPRVPEATVQTDDPSQGPLTPVSDDWTPVASVHVPTTITFTREDRWRIFLFGVNIALHASVETENNPGRIRVRPATIILTPKVKTHG